MNRILYTSFLLFTFLAYSQSDPNNLVLNGNSNILNKNYKDAEIDYRKAISTNNTNVIKMKQAVTPDKKK